MARRLRIQFPGARYHAINRGNLRHDIFATAGARRSFAGVTGEASARIGAPGKRPISSETDVGPEERAMAASVGARTLRDAVAPPYRWLAEKLCMGKPGSVCAYVHAQKQA